MGIKDLEKETTYRPAVKVGPAQHKTGHMITHIVMVFLLIAIVIFVDHSFLDGAYLCSTYTFCLYIVGVLVLVALMLLAYFYFHVWQHMKRQMSGEKLEQLVDPHKTEHLELKTKRHRFVRSKKTKAHAHPSDHHENKQALIEEARTIRKDRSEQPDDATDNISDDAKSCLQVIADAQAQVKNHNVPGAVRLYKKAQKKYEALSVHEQKVLYNLLHTLYELIHTVHHSSNGKS